MAQLNSKVSVVPFGLSNETSYLPHPASFNDGYWNSSEGDKANVPEKISRKNNPESSAKESVAIFRAYFRAVDITQMISKTLILAISSALY